MSVHMQNFSVLISTANQRIKTINFEKLKGVNCVLIHQLYDGSNCNDIDMPDHISYQQLDFAGLSKSRNAALSLCTTKYAYIMDDDVEFDLEKIGELVKQMEKHKVDVATCQFRYQNGNSPKQYAVNPFVHNMLSAAKVASIELCINIESLNKHNIRFDERFGLGAEYPSGEEYIFLTDCLKVGLHVAYFPIVTGIHPNETSGLDFFTSADKTLAKRAMLQRIFGWKSMPYTVAFWLKKLPLVLKKGYGWTFTKTLLLGKK